MNVHIIKKMLKHAINFIWIWCEKKVCTNSLKKNRVPWNVCAQVVYDAETTSIKYKGEEEKTKCEWHEIRKLKRIGRNETALPIKWNLIECEKRGGNSFQKCKKRWPIFELQLLNMATALIWGVDHIVHAQIKLFLALLKKTTSFTWLQKLLHHSLFVTTCSELIKCKTVKRKHGNLINNHLLSYT